ncbi:MAG TPA: HAMP domain-containing sensor histidine kinase [Anaeromyxobacteraceae bacterium]|nr:HAMP domain-containing sensor histidine kinase [Anaeromyxobacteraceae bacterium]
MTAPPMKHRHRIALRIYLVSAAALAAVLLAIYVFATVVLRPPARGGPFADKARYAAAKIAERWASPAAVAEEVEAVLLQMHVAATAYRWDGTLVASGAPRPAAPLADGERLALGRAPVLERGGACRREQCELAIAVPGPAGPKGYLVLQDALRHPGPPPFGSMGVALLVVALGVAAALLGRSIARPLARLAATAQALGRGDLHARTGLFRRDELGAVASAFDEMAARLEQLVLAQTELHANVAHELRTPLARIRLALELAESGDAAVARESLGEIAEDLSELEALVDDILASARMELARGSVNAGAPPLRLAPLEIGQVVSGAADRLRHRHPRRRIDVQLEPDLPGLQGDPGLLRRALDNLVDNARKYSPPGSTIRLRAARRGADIVVEVIDSGEGIPAEDLARLFTPFFRGDKSRTRATGGVGLGLSLARRIVEAHGGTLSAESAPGIGTTMTVTLPANGEGVSRSAAP